MLCVIYLCAYVRVCASIFGVCVYVYVCVCVCVCVFECVCVCACVCVHGFCVLCVFMAFVYYLRV